MGKPGSDGALLKRPASQVSSNDGPLFSGVAVEELEATGDINDFRKRARELDLVTQHRISDGGCRNRSRADILESLPGKLREVGSAQSHVSEVMFKRSAPLLMEESDGMSRRSL